MGGAARRDPGVRRDPAAPALAEAARIAARAARVR